MSPARALRRLGAGGCVRGQPWRLKAKRRTEVRLFLCCKCTTGYCCDSTVSPTNQDMCSGLAGCARCSDDHRFELHGRHDARGGDDDGVQFLYGSLRCGFSSIAVEALAMLSLLLRVLMVFMCGSLWSVVGAALLMSELYDPTTRGSNGLRPNGESSVRNANYCAELRVGRAISAGWRGAASVSCTCRSQISIPVKPTEKTRNRAFRQAYTGLIPVEGETHE